MRKTWLLDCELDYDVLQQTVFVFHINVPDDSNQRVIEESTSVFPDTTSDEFRDPSGMNRLIRVDAPPGQLTLRYLAAVEVESPAFDRNAQQVPIASLPADALPYLRPSRYCESDQLFPLACNLFGHLPQDFTRVEAICEWIRANIRYQVGTSTPTTTAQDVLSSKAGVCRDFAHLGIAFCRALNIPARLVTAYARYDEPPPDFHALFEAYLGDRWYLFDPTLLARLDEIVRIGTGTDASEVAFATFFGAARLRRLSPLIEPSRNATPAGSQLARLQQPDSGILLAA